MVVKYLTKQFKDGKVCFGSQLEGVVHRDREVVAAELKSAHHNACDVRKQRER